MTDQEWLTLRRAARLSGYRRKALLALVERGQLPAVRRDGRWLIAPADLARVRSPAASPALGAPVAASPGAAEVASAAEAQEAADGRRDLALLLDALRARDEQIARLQEERARMAGQIGFLQGLLVEREARLRVLEALPAPRPELPMAGAPAAAEPTPDTARANGHDGALVDGGGDVRPVTTIAAPPESETTVTTVPTPFAVASDAAMPAFEHVARRPRRLLLMLRFLGRRA